MANPMYGQNKFDNNLGSGKYLENKLALGSWNFGHLSLQPAADTTLAKSLLSGGGITLVDGQIAECLTDGDTSASQIYLMTPVYLSEYTPSVAIAGGTIVAVADLDNTLTYATTATNNQTHIGAELAFFCEDKGLWKLAFLGSELGSGAINATFTIS